MNIESSFSKSKVLLKMPAVIVAVCSILWFDALSQGTQTFESQENEDKARQEKNEKIVAKMKDLPDPKPIEPEPSRNTGEEMPQYILARAAVFSMRDRDTGPFLLEQDPNAKPVEKRVTKRRVTRRAALPPTPLAEVVKLIRVTTIMPSEKKFLVGIRSFSESDEFPIEYQGKTIQVKVVSVTARKIVFRDLGKGEEATLETEMLPPGMVAGGDSLKPPGMVSPDLTLPLQLGSGDRLVNPNN